MATPTTFYCWTADLAHGVHVLNSDTLKVALTNVAPTRSNSILADLTEISAGNGYSAGGNTATFVSGSQTLGVYKLLLEDVSFVASGGPIGPFRYCTLYNSRPASKPLICFLDYGVSITLSAGQTFLVDLSAVSGALSLASAS